MEALVNLCTTVVGKVLLALVVWFVGKFIIKKVTDLVAKIKVLDKIEPNTRTFVLSALKWLLYIILVVSIVAILGVPMASVITVLGTAGAAIALSLQGSLGNLAGGIMLVIFRPFKVGDYVETSGVAGTVKEINLFYTVLNTVDNCRINVPNGSLMNANIIDYSAEETRRVDLSFASAKSEDPTRIQNLMLEVMDQNAKVLKDPAPFARVSGGTNEAMQFTVRAWCKTADYWDVYFDLTQAITEKLGESGVQAPAVRVISEKEYKTKNKRDGQALYFYKLCPSLFIPFSLNNTGSGHKSSSDSLYTPHALTDIFLFSLFGTVIMDFGRECGVNRSFPVNLPAFRTENGTVFSDFPGAEFGSAQFASNHIVSFLPCVVRIGQFLCLLSVASLC
ncbi:MAG: mechanosensitive ion channel family protein [Firmicutes bacterium]|nr:mechanosensitive ion channel family protein [Bacillota bacterium]